MARYSLKNSKLGISVDSLGAELKSLKKLSNDTEYMWDANPEYWNRTSPLLFPFVGILHNGRYRHNGKEYTMPKHGFARNKEFELLGRTEEELRFLLRADEETRKCYPFEFELEQSYRFDKEDENRLVVSWKVTNRGGSDMYFSIGGHPAFRCPIDGKGRRSDCTLAFDAGDMLISGIVGKNSMISERTKELILRDGRLAITEDMFDEDALIIEHGQAHQVSLCDGSGQPYVTVSFDAPVFGVWSPVRRDAPFVCIEPWHGLCDREGFEGELYEREYMHKLAPNGEFHAGYSILV